MPQIVILDRKCDGCGLCVKRCPFGGVGLIEGKAQLNAACRACGLCVKACPHGAILSVESKAKQVDTDLSKWRGILVFAEQHGGHLHPVSLELLGKALSLAKNSAVNQAVHPDVSSADNPIQPILAVVVGENVGDCADELRHYGADIVYVYDDPELSFFRADAFAACLEDCIGQTQPGVVLVGATAMGRSLAPRAAVRFRTGLTADCTGLELREDGGLIQTRPAFGGNIMARIVTPHTRPQFATVRYKVMDAPARSVEPSGRIIRRDTPKAVAASLAKLIGSRPVPKALNISEAEIIIAAGRGVKRESDLVMFQELAALLGGEFAVSRPLAEKGWASGLRQIGLSGRTVRPRLILTFGISGSVQFAAGMSGSERIIAINSDPDAPILKIAHAGIVGDLYEIVPRLIESLNNQRETSGIIGREVRV
ncbi:electron transfer flavoprotein subunit alpha [Clostridia bacterium]|nr:electron transfer flavoprotein subunit alpha [Clostridia bacterium]